MENIISQMQLGGGNMLYYIITGAAMLVSKAVGSMLQKKFKQYSASPINLSGAEVAKRMLDDAGISDVKIIHTGGQLTDHYNPMSKTVNLSDVVYEQRNVAAAAVAAHECGHAIQHAKAYGPLKMRSGLVPVLKISSKFTPILLMAGIAIMAASGNTMVLMLGVILFAVTTLFAFVTLPVEFDASRRALAWLENSGVTQGQYQDQAKDALKWAAMTYVVAALASLGQLLFYVMRLMGARRQQYG